MPRVAQGLRLAEVLTSPGGLRSMVSARPFSSSAFLLARDLHQGCGPLGTVVDVGANAGQFAVAMAREFPGAHLLALEPLPDVAHTLRTNVSSCGRVRVLECAAGASTGSATMHRHPYTLSSSLLATNGAFASVFPAAARHGVPQPVEVSVARLDDVVSDEDLRGPTLLKLDVQGFEIEALCGAERLLTRCDWVLAETALEPVYDDEPGFADLYSHLTHAGFVFDRPVDFLRGARGTVAQMDVLFRRDSVPPTRTS